MQEIILAKMGEIVLKGLNKRSFEDALIRTVKRRLTPLGQFEIVKAQSAVYIKPLGDCIDLDEAQIRVSRIFGIAALSRARVAPKDIEIICSQTVSYLRERLEEINTFKVEAKRADKAFPLKSPEICEEVGAYVLEQFPHLRVDVHKPDMTVTVEIRDFGAYIRGNSVKGAGGMPVGTGGKAAILISGGIDSPVAAWTMAKRGITLTAVHFVSPPYTSERAEQKVLDLLKEVSKYSGDINVKMVPFTKIQEEIVKSCPEELFTLIMRRMMMKIAEHIAKSDGCEALITGESVGQVASQTMPAIACTDAVCSMPVFRPLIGMDKEEIVTIARKIGTFDISIQPFEDCCTVFTPKHPRTRPSINAVIEAESVLDINALIGEAVENTRCIKVICEEAIS